MLLVDLKKIPLPGAVVPRFRQTRGIVNPYFVFAAHALFVLCWRSSLLKMLLTRQSAEHGAVKPQTE
jgi:hypothetical protein